MHQSAGLSPEMLGIIILSFAIVSVSYFLPSIVAFWRGHERRGAILFLNVIAGWTGVVRFASDRVRDVLSG